MRVRLPRHQFTRTVVLAADTTAHEAPVVQEELQAWFKNRGFWVTRTSAIGPLTMAGNSPGRM